MQARRLKSLKKLPPEVSAEIRRSGLYVSGSESGVYGLEGYYQEKFGMKVTVAETGSAAAALGGGAALGDEELLKKIIIRFK